MTEIKYQHTSVQKQYQTFRAMPFISKCLPVAKCARQDVKIKLISLRSLARLRKHNVKHHTEKHILQTYLSMTDDYSASFRSFSLHSAREEISQDETVSRQVYVSASC